MKKAVAVLAGKAGKRAALVPVAVRSWPFGFNQPKMPDAMRQRMVECDKR